MKYIRTIWKHDDPGQPIKYYSEIDDERWEVRAIEVYRDGKLGYASRDERVNADLSEHAIPELADIDSEFEATEISREDFERLWNQAHTQSKAGSR